MRKLLEAEEDEEISNLGIIFTSFHNENRSNNQKIDYIAEIEKLGESPIDRIEEKLNRKIKKEKKIENVLLKLLTISKEPVSPKLRKKVSNIRNRNTHNFLLQGGRSLFDRATYIMDKICQERIIKDPKKSLSYFFVDLAIFKIEAHHKCLEASLLDVLSETKTIKANALTEELEENEQKIVDREIEFYRKICIEFLNDDPSTAILRAYLRNHNEKQLKKGRIHRLTKAGIRMTGEILNSTCLNLGVDLSIIDKYE